MPQFLIGTINYGTVEPHLNTLGSSRVMLKQLNMQTDKNSAILQFYNIIEKSVNFSETFLTMTFIDTRSI